MSDKRPVPADFSAMFEKNREHAAKCKKRPCRVCYLDTCPSCGGDRPVEPELRFIEGEAHEFKLCPGCADREVTGHAIRDIEKRIPGAFAWSRFGVPELSARCGATRAQIKQAWDACVVGRESLALVGPTGAGKTSLGIALVRGVVDRAMRKDATPRDVARAKKCFYVSAFDLARDRARYPLGEGETPLVRRSMFASVLLIDDLGNEPDSQLSAVSDVIYERHAQGRPTWVTTYLDEPACGAKYGALVARRIFERSTILHLAKRGGS
jgi:hypothetical protein